MSHKATDVVEDLLFMIHHGEHPANAARRVNRKPGPAAKLLKRYGYTEEAAYMDREVRYLRTHKKLTTAA